MPASFPGAVKTFTTKVDGAGNIIFAAHVNDLQDEVTAMEQYLVGTGVSTVIVPDATRTRDLGSTTRRWRDLFMGRTIDMDQGTITADAAAWKSVATWNAGGVTFVHFDVNITDTASAVASLLLRMQIGGSNRLTVNKSGDLVANGSLAVGTTPATAGAIRLPNNSNFNFRNAANSANISAAAVDASDNVQIGDANALNIILRAGPGGTVRSHADGGSNLGSASERWAELFMQTAIRIGTNPATTGAIRVANTGELVSRNAANSANFGLIQGNASDRVVISASANDIQWGVPLVALGGGATPTFGTIGGSGPATAAQNSWQRIVDSTGAAFWVPAWK